MNTRQNLLEATRRIIEERGISRVTTKEIAREAGCAEGTLYKHFEHKEDLFLATIHENIPLFIETLQDYQPGQNTIQENLTAIALAVLKYYGQILPLAASFFADIDLMKRYRKVMEELNVGPMRVYERVAAYIAEEQKCNRIKPEQDPIGIATLLLGPCFQYAFQIHFLGKKPFPTSDVEYVEGVVGILCAGLLRTSA
jgi:AcrR family transcriptional regulator